MAASTTRLLNNVKAASIAGGNGVPYTEGELTMERLVAAADAGDQIALREIADSAILAPIPAMARNQDAWQASFDQAVK